MNHIVIKVENGIVTEVFSTEPVNLIVVDRDVIRGGETFGDLMVKAVTMTIERRIPPEEVGRTVESLVLERKLPMGRRATESTKTAAVEVGT